MISWDYPFIYNDSLFRLSLLVYVVDKYVNDPNTLILRSFLFLSSSLYRVKVRYWFTVNKRRWVGK